jgi:hypothetical protein
MEQTYNGWHNWATWNAKLWLDNDEGLHNRLNYELQELLETTSLDDVPYELSQKIHNLLMDMLKFEELHGIQMDFTNATLEKVNTLEIAHSIFEDYIGYDKYKKLFPTK